MILDIVFPALVKILCQKLCKNGDLSESEDFEEFNENLYDLVFNLLNPSYFDRISADKALELLE